MTKNLKPIQQYKEEGIIGMSKQMVLNLAKENVPIMTIMIGTEATGFSLKEKKIEEWNGVKWHAFGLCP